MTVTHHEDLVQGSEEWAAQRCGLLTASEMKLIVTPTLKMASNEKERGHLYELLSQRITQYVEPQYVGYDMLRGKEEEVEARILYASLYQPVTECGFITNDRFGFTLGFSPDGLVGEDGFIECKSRRQKFQVETIINSVDGVIPDEFMIQIQTGFVVSERKWCDFVSYSGGLPMATIRVLPDPQYQVAIIEAARAFEARLTEKLMAYEAALRSRVRLAPTERKIEQEMFMGDAA